jgi:hypothetical protein
VLSVPYLHGISLPCCPAPPKMYACSWYGAAGMAPSLSITLSALMATTLKRATRTPLSCNYVGLHTPNALSKYPT